MPVFNTDAIRSEVKEDSGRFDIPEFDRRRAERFAEMLGRLRPFIYDASVDRLWPEMSQQLQVAGYDVFVVSLDLSPDFLRRLYEAKGYDLAVVDKYHADHQAFLETYSEVVSLHINDADFPHRLELAAVAIEHWLGQEGNS